MLAPRVEHDAVRFGEHVRISLHRTLRIPEGEREFPLPPSFGRFPLFPLTERMVGDLGWPTEHGVFQAAIPIRPYEALWIALEGPEWLPHAVKIGAGRVNVVSGDPWDELLHSQPQDYLVCPDQPWLDGINAGDGFVRQFVAIQRWGTTLEGQLCDTVVTGGIRAMVVAPKAGRFREETTTSARQASGARAVQRSDVGEPLALAVGGRVRQRIYPDVYGSETWDLGNTGSAIVHLLDSARFHALTGRLPAPSPINAQEYARLGLPWFELADADHADLAPAPAFNRVRSVGETERVDADHLTAPELDPDALPVRKLSRERVRDSGGNV